MLKGRNGAGIEAEFFEKELHEVFRENHISDAKGRGDGFGKGIEVQNIIAVRQNKEWFGGLGRDRKFRAVVRFDDITAVFLRPTDIFVPLGRRRGDAARKAAVRCGVQNVGGRFFQSRAVDSVFGKGQKLTADVRRMIDFFDFIVGRRFDGVGLVTPQKFDDQAVKIFRSRAENDLFDRHENAAVAGKIAPNRFAKKRKSRVRRLLQDGFAVIGQHAPHGLA